MSDYRGPSKHELDAARAKVDAHFSRAIVEDDTLTAWRTILLALRLGSQPEEHAVVQDLAQSMVYMAASKDSAERALESAGVALDRIHARKRRNSEQILAITSPKKAGHGDG